MIDPQLVKCPQCAINKPNAYMGSITSDGYFIVKRGAFRDYDNRNFYHAASDVMMVAEKYSIVCECGYIIWVDHGKITTALSLGNNDEKSTDFRV